MFNKNRLIFLLGIYSILAEIFGLFGSWNTPGLSFTTILFNHLVYIPVIAYVVLTLRIRH